MLQLAALGALPHPQSTSLQASSSLESISTLSCSDAQTVSWNDSANAWVCGDAMSLPFPDNYFDAYTISFGIRNVTKIEDALREAYRVLRTGGRLIILEFSKIPNDVLRLIYDKYSFSLIPRMGELVVGDMESYRYLVESIRQFPDQEKFSAMIKSAGFLGVKYRNLSLGIVALHSGWKI